MSRQGYRGCALLSMGACLLWAAPAVQAQSCDEPLAHVVQDGESLTSIALDYLDDERRWTALYSANAAVLTAANATDVSGAKVPDALWPGVAAGVELRIPCLSPQGPGKLIPQVNQSAELRLLAGSGYSPFADRALTGGGIVTRVVSAAFDAAPSAVATSLLWVDDTSRHLKLLADKQYDVGFPWMQPDCRRSTSALCGQFHFSEPVFHTATLLFVNKDAPLNYSGDASLDGKRICHAGDAQGFQPVTEAQTWLEAPGLSIADAASAEACFGQLIAGEVDGVALNEFAGRLALESLAEDATSIVEERRPLSVDALHAVISRTHIRGTTSLYRLNGGLKQLSEDGRLQSMIDHALAGFWARIPPSDDGMVALAGMKPEDANAPQAGPEPAPEAESETSND